MGLFSVILLSSFPVFSIFPFPLCINIFKLVNFLKVPYNYLSPRNNYSLSCSQPRWKRKWKSLCPVHFPSWKALLFWLLWKYFLLISFLLLWLPSPIYASNVYVPCYCVLDPLLTPDTFSGQSYPFLCKQLMNFISSPLLTKRKRSLIFLFYFLLINLNLIEYSLPLSLYSFLIIHMVYNSVWGEKD